MRNLIIFLLVISFCACKKSSNSSSSPVTTIANSIGLQFEKKYTIGDAPSPTSGSYHSDTIIFHSNNTITEYAGSLDTTYNVVYLPESNLVTSIYANGQGLKIYLPNNGVGSSALLFSFCQLAQSNNDTLVIAKFESGGAVVNSNATLACQVGNDVNNAVFLWLNSF